MFEVSELKKTYDGFQAVDDVSFEINEGEVFGLVGPNGAGKTTTLKILAGLLDPTDGDVSVGGANPKVAKTRASIGFLPEESPLYEEMTGLSYLRFFADLYGVESETANDRIEQTLNRLNLDQPKKPIGDMSKGMKRKIAIIRALINDPSVLIFDEPASGLDPLTTDVVLEFTGELQDRGKTILLSAHNLYHVERICDRIAIMNDGQLLTLGSLKEIRDQFGSVTYRVYTTVEVPNSIERNGNFLTEVDTMSAVEETREAASAAGGTVIDIRTDEATLEDIFLDLTGQRSGHIRA